MSSRFALNHVFQSWCSLFGKFWFQFSARRSAIVAYTGKNWAQILIIKLLISNLKIQTEWERISAGAAVPAMATQLTLLNKNIILGHGWDGWGCSVPPGSRASRATFLHADNQDVTVNITFCTIASAHAGGRTACIRLPLEFLFLFNGRNLWHFLAYPGVPLAWFPGRGEAK